MMFRVLVALTVVGAGMLTWSAGTAWHRRLLGRSDGPRSSAVVFTSPGCPACRTMHGVISTLGSDLRSRIRTVDVTIDADAARRHRIMTVPTTVFYDGSGAVDRIAYGVVDAVTFRTHLVGQSR